jgi:O-antigen/teichoic acid export membrane protein
MAWHTRLPRRLIVMIGGEGMQSALHFGLNIALLRTLAPRDYGVFAIVMVIGGLGLTYIRALTAMPASIRIGSSRGPRAAAAHDVIFGSGALVLAGLIAILVAAMLRLWLGADGLAGGAFVGLWSLRSHVRTATFARGRPLLATLGDLVFTACGALMALGLILVSGEARLHAAFVVLALANGLGIAAMLILSRGPIRISLRRGVRRHYARLWRQLAWSALSVSTTNLQGQGFALLVAAIAGPAAYAPIAAAFVLFVPLRLVATAVVNLKQPALASHLARGETGRVWRQALDWTAILGAGGLLYGAAAMVALPLLRAPSFEGDTLRIAGAFAWAILTTMMLYVMPRIILEAVGAFRTIAAITAGAGAVGMAMVACLLLVTSASWSLAGALASELIVLGACWAVLRRMVGTAVPARPGYLATRTR